MTAYIGQRLIQAFFVIIIVSILVFVAIRFLPGDPILMFLSQEETDILTPEQVEQARREFGLDKPLLVQYINWVSDLLHGDFGTSLFYHEKVGKLLIERLPVTLHLGLLAFIISAILGIAAGTISALRRGDYIDTLMTMVANLGITVPIFWLGILLIYLFGLQLRWLPIFGYTSPFDDFWLSTKQLFMPICCLSVFSLASTARQTRSSMLEVIRQDYVRTAWAKGLRERTVVIRHVLKNGLIPVITLKGMAIRHILGGSVLVETVFNVPGMGRLSVEAVFSQDYAIVQAVILLSAIIVVLANLLVDISYGWLDPRIRYD
jgi:peptide/nickel transport system permease protein